MVTTVLRRLIVLPLMLLGVTLITFTITNVIPADPARVAAGLNAPEEQVARLRAELGIDQPILVQYWRYLTNLSTGNWGMSSISQRPVLPDIRSALPATLEILVLATIGFIVIGVPFGVIVGTTSNRFGSAAASVVAYIGMAFPVFWLGLMLQVLFYRELNWLPAVGRIGPGIPIPATVTGFYTIDSIIAGNWQALTSSLRHLALPVISLVMARFAVTARFVATGMQAAMRTDYARTAKAKGVSDSAVIVKHALRNVLIPVNTMLGLQFGWLLSGSILIESIFSWPGIGWYAWRSIVSLDFQPIVGVTLVFSAAFIIINLLTDLMYGVLDPRVADQQGT